MLTIQKQLHTTPTIHIRIPIIQENFQTIKTIIFLILKYHTFLLTIHLSNQISIMGEILHSVKLLNHSISQIILTINLHNHFQWIKIMHNLCSTEILFNFPIKTGSKVLSWQKNSLFVIITLWRTGLIRRNIKLMKDMRMFQK